MPIDGINSTQNISNEQNRKAQAIFSTAIGGVVGGALGAATAPPKVKSLSGLITCKQDIFDKTIKNASKQTDMLTAQTQQIIYNSRLQAETIEQSVNMIFPEDSISKKDYSEFIDQKKIFTKQQDRGFKAFIKDLEQMKGQDYSNKVYYELLEKNNVMPKFLLDMQLEETKALCGEDFGKAICKIDDTLVNSLDSYFKKSVTSNEKLIKSLEDGLKFEKDGIIKKTDFVTIFKKSTIETIKETLDNLGEQAFNSFKKFVPKNRLKSALITTGGAGIIAGLTTYIFQPGQKKFDKQMTEAKKN